MAKRICVDKDLKEISLINFTKLRSNDEYRFIAQYESDKLKIDVEWLGSCDTDIPREYWTPFRLTLYNRIVTGDRPGTYVIKNILDPVAAESFKTQVAALESYYTALADMGLIEVVEDYCGDIDFIEVGNRLKSKISELKFEGFVTTLINKRTKNGVNDLVGDLKNDVKTSELFGSW